MGLHKYKMKIDMKKKTKILVLSFLVILILVSCCIIVKLSSVNGAMQGVNDCYSRVHKNAYNMDDISTINDDYCWIDSFVIDDVLFKINAEIEFVNNGYLTVDLYRRVDFGTLTVNQFVSYFVEGADGAKEYTWTKEELEQVYHSIEMGQPLENEDGEVIFTPYQNQEEILLGVKEQIDNAENDRFRKRMIQIENLPVNQVYSFPNGERLYANISEDCAYLTKYSQNTMILQQQSWITDYASAVEPEGVLIEPSISENEAIKKAENTIEEIGIQNMELSHIEKARLCNQYTYEQLSEGWIVIFTPMNDDSNPVDLLSLRTDGFLNFSTNESNERWQQETVSIYIDEKGIQGFYWVEPKEIVKNVNANAEIMKLEQIKPLIINYIEQGYDDSHFKDILQAKKIRVTEMFISNIFEGPQKNANYSVSVPAWIVIYEVEFESYEKEEYAFAINAIDGKIIDLVWKPDEEYY